MTMHPRARTGLLIAALLAPLSAPASAQTVSLARDLGDGTRELITSDAELGLPLARLSGLTFRAPQLAGRARVQTLRADLPNLRGAASAAEHLRLPGGGAIYLAAQGDVEHVLLVNGRGLPRTLLDSNEAGAGFQPWLAASDDGRRLLIASVDDRVWLLDTVGRRRARELSPARPVSGIAGESLRVASDTAWMVADGRLLRAALKSADPRFTPVADSLAADESLFAELAVSADGNHVAAVSETAGGGRRLLHAGSTGPLELVLDAVDDYDLPELRDAGGPYLALSNDGSFVAWRNTVLVKEVFTRRVTSPASATQVTADANVADTFDGSGILGFTSDDRLLLAVGEAQPGDPETLLDRAEFFTLDPAVPGAPLQNLSMTSGEVVPPFTAGGDLEIRDLFETPSGERLLLELDPDDGDEAFMLLDLGTPGALETLIPGGDQLGSVIPAGKSALIVRPPLGPLPARLDVLTPDHALLSLPLPPGVVALDRFAAEARGRFGACVLRFGDGTEMPLLLDLLDAGSTPLSMPTEAVSEGLAFSTTGRVVLGLGDPPHFALVAPGLQPIPLRLPPGDALPLQP